MPTYRYVGGHDEIEIPDLGVVVKRRKTIEAPHAIGDNLVLQDVWELVEEPVEKPKKSDHKETTP